MTDKKISQLDSGGTCRTTDTLAAYRSGASDDLGVAIAKYGSVATLDVDDAAAGTLAVAYGGTASATASAARTALGLAIDTDVQAYDAALADIAGLTLAGGDVFYVDNSGDIQNLAKGSNGDFLSLSAGLPAWATAASGLANVSEDATPQLGADLDANGQNIGFDDATGITDDSGNEQLIFQSTASAINQIEITNAALGNPPELGAAGDDTNVDLKLTAQAAGVLRAANTVVPHSSDGAALGTSSLMFSDLFLASGAVINFDNGDVTATHSANALAFAGGTISFDASPTVSGNAVVDDADIGVTVQAYDADTLKADTADVLTAGFATTPYNAGTQSSGTFTPDESNGNFQYAVNGGAHTVDPPSNSCSIVVQFTNNASAGAQTTSNFTIVTGDSLTTTDGDDFFFYMTKNNGFSHLHVVALQ